MLCFLLKCKLFAAESPFPLFAETWRSWAGWGLASGCGQFWRGSWVVWVRMRRGNYTGCLHGRCLQVAALLPEDLYSPYTFQRASVLAERCVGLCTELCLAETMRNQFPRQELRNHWDEVVQGNRSFELCSAMRGCEVWEWGELNSAGGMWVAGFEPRTEDVVFEWLGVSIIWFSSNIAIKIKIAISALTLLSLG